MDSLYKIIIDALNEKVTDVQKYTDELYGYRDNLPEYRVFKRKLYVDYIDEEGVLRKDVLLKRPNTHMNGLSYDSFVELRLSTGLLFLPQQIDELLEDELEESLYKVIERIYDHQIEISAARMIIDESMIEDMYVEIAKRFYIQ